MVCYRLFVIGAVSAALILGSACSGDRGQVQNQDQTEGPGILFFEASGEVMGTTWSAKAAGHYGDAAELLAALNEAVEGVDARMSTYKKDSEISRFGRTSPNTPFAVSADTFLVVADALKIAGRTGGAFDPTIMPLVDLWGFGPDPAPEAEPSAEAIAAAMEGCGYTKVTMVDGNGKWLISKRVDGLRLDLSAIAKGHGVDAMAQALDRLEVSHYLVEIGGELRSKGVASGGVPWLVGIDAPRFGQGPGRPLQAAVPLQDRSIATSGNYRNYRVFDGKRYSHTLDPRTGRPVEHDLASVTVLAPTCREADAWATACMVLGADAALAIIESYEDLECYLLVHDGEDFVGRTSSGFPELTYP